LAKNLKLNIKNTQIAEAINLGGLKEKFAKRKADIEELAPSSEEKANLEKPEGKATITPEAKAEADERPKEEVKRVRARSRSMFAEPRSTLPLAAETEQELVAKKSRKKSSEELRQEIFGEVTAEPSLPSEEAPGSSSPPFPISSPLPPQANEPPTPMQEILPLPKATLDRLLAPKRYPRRSPLSSMERLDAPIPQEKKETSQLGPTGRHINDLLNARLPKPEEKVLPVAAPGKEEKERIDKGEEEKKAKGRVKEGTTEETTTAKKVGRPGKATREFRDLKPAAKKSSDQRSFDARDRYGLRSSDEEQHWRKKRAHKHIAVQEDTTTRPTSLKVRLPIALKDLAVEMKLKASQLLAKLLIQGVMLTLNDQLDDETVVQLLGQEFGCDITIDRAEQERIRITDKSIQEEIAAAASERLYTRPPVVAFMGHVDHGKTSLIDAIRSSNRAASEAGAITQHMGAFRCTTAVGDLTILDTPGHEAFSAMRARGAKITDIVVLVVAGDEGIRQQTVEAIQHAKAAQVAIVVAINKCDKPNFNAEQVYRQLAEHELLPEVWGGQTVTVPCSATSGEGVNTLLEMLALQAEVLELKASPDMRARGTVLESQMHKGLGVVATVLVQNGTLRHGDAVVFESLWGRIKTMKDEFGQEIEEALPSTPVAITGLSGLPDAGEEFIVVKNEKEAREIAEVRLQGMRQARLLQKPKFSLESLLQQAQDTPKKILNVVLRADVQGSLEALRTALEKIESSKVIINVIFAGIGEIAESDVHLAAASKTIILGFHTQVEHHADLLIKELGVQVRLHDIIYHAVDDIKDIMSGLLDKVAQEEIKGKALVKATFKSSHHGTIAGCQVVEGTIHRNNKMRIIREKETIWQGDIASLRRVKEDVREVQKGLECGILLVNCNNLMEGDILEAFQVVYLSQQL